LMLFTWLDVKLYGTHRFESKCPFLLENKNLIFRRSKKLRVLIFLTVHCNLLVMKMLKNPPIDLNIEDAIIRINLKCYYFLAHIFL